MAEKIIKTEYSEEMQKSYMNYSMSVITARAIPDTRDAASGRERSWTQSIVLKYPAYSFLQSFHEARSAFTAASVSSRPVRLMSTSIRL